MRLVTALVVVLGLAACGDGESRSGPQTDDLSSDVTAGVDGRQGISAPSEMTCGGFRFPPDALTAPPEAAKASHPSVATMRSLLSDEAGRASFEATAVDTSLVRVLDEGASHAVLGIGDPTAPGFVDGSPFFVVVRLEPADGSWAPVSWSGCDLRVGSDSPPGEAPVRWYPTDDVSPEERSIPIAVLEEACASGQSAEGRVRAPEIEYCEDAIVVTVSVEPRSGDQECPGNAPTPYVLELVEPVGDRQLLDGGRFPPAPPPDPNPPEPPLTDLPADALEPDPDGNVTLLVANQSDSVEPVELHHMITGAVLPQASYRRDQGWVEYRFDLPAGLHQISVAAVGPGGIGQDGLEEFFEVTGPTWLLLRYSGDGGEGSLSVSFHKRPPQEATE